MVVQYIPLYVRQSVKVLVVVQVSPALAVLVPRALVVFQAIVASVVYLASPVFRVGQALLV